MKQMCRAHGYNNVLTNDENVTVLFSLSPMYSGIDFLNNNLTKIFVDLATLCNCNDFTFYKYIITVNTKEQG